MLYKKQGSDWVAIDPMAKRGLSWVTIRHENVWGKIAGIWRRGSKKAVTITFDPPVKKVYWDIELWKELGYPTEDLEVKIVVGKNAVIAQSFTPSPDTLANWEADRLLAAELYGSTKPPFVPKEAALDLAGGWGLNTTFEVSLYAPVMGCSGYGGEPIRTETKVQPTAVAAGKGPSLSVGKTTESLQDAVYGMVHVGPQVHIGLCFGIWSDGFIDGFFQKGNPGGAGGAGIRTNRPTKINIMTNPDGTIGSVSGGGGGGGGIGSFWRRYYGGAFILIQIRGGYYIVMGQTPVYSNMFGAYGPETVADDTFTKQWSLAGWGGAMGAGCTLAYGLGPQRSEVIQPFSNDPASNTNKTFYHVCKEGRLVTPWPRAQATRFRSDGVNGRWWGQYDGIGMDYYSSSKITHAAMNVPGRSAGSGHADGATVHFAAPAAVVNSNHNVLSNDFISAIVSAPTATVIDATVASLAAASATTGSPTLKMYERGSAAAKFKGGAAVGALVPYTADTVIWSGEAYYSRGFKLYYSRQRNGGDYLMEVTLASGTGGKLGKPGNAAVLNYGGSSLAWTTSQCGGYSHFPVLQDGANNKLAGPGGAAGPAIIGSEYVTIVGAKNPAGDAKSINGAIVPFA